MIALDWSGCFVIHTCRRGRRWMKRRRLIAGEELRAGQPVYVADGIVRVARLEPSGPELQFLDAAVAAQGLDPLAEWQRALAERLLKGDGSGPPVGFMNSGGG